MKRCIAIVLVTGLCLGAAPAPKEDDAKKCRLKKQELEQTMRDLFSAARIGLERYDKPSLHRYRLVAK